VAVANGEPEVIPDCDVGVGPALVPPAGDARAARAPAAGAAGGAARAQRAVLHEAWLSEQARLEALRDQQALERRLQEERLEALRGEQAAQERRLQEQRLLLRAQDDALMEKSAQEAARERRLQEQAALEAGTSRRLDDLLQEQRRQEARVREARLEERLAQQTALLQAQEAQLAALAAQQKSSRSDGSCVPAPAMRRGSPGKHGAAHALPLRPPAPPHSPPLTRPGVPSLLRRTPRVSSARTTCSCSSTRAPR